MMMLVMVQYLGQIYSVYGQHDSKAFLNAKAKNEFALNDWEDAKYFLALMCNKTVKVTSNTVSSGREGSFGQWSWNQNCQGKPLLTESDIHTFKIEKIVILKEGLHPIVANKV